MTASVNFTIIGKPVPWARMGRNKDTYFQKPKQAAAKQAVGLACKAAMRKEGVTMAQKGYPVTVRVHAVYKLPDRLPKGDTRRMGDPHAIKPDCDNLLKLVKDALSGVAYEDDAQVFTAYVWKQWSDHNATHVTVQYIGPRRQSEST